MANDLDVICGVCKVKCGSGSISCTQCVKWYHSKCVKLSNQQLNHFNKELKQQNGERWVCETCLNIEVMLTENRSQNKRKKPEDAEFHEEIRDKNWSINDVMEKLFDMDRKYNVLWSKYEQQIEVNNTLKLEVADLKKQLSSEINKSEQREIKNNAILKGIPVSTTADDGELVKKMGNLLEVPVGRFKSYRLGRASNGERPALLKVCFENENDKLSFIKAQKRKKLSTIDLGFKDLNNNIYIEHDLTKKNQELYKEARKYRKEHDYKFVWIRDGKTYIRKDENSKAILVDDIKVLKN